MYDLRKKTKGATPPSEEGVRKVVENCTCGDGKPHLHKHLEPGAGGSGSGGVTVIYAVNAGKLPVVHETVFTKRYHASS